MQVRVTPIAEDGTRGETVVHDDVTDYEYNQETFTSWQDSEAVRETLVLQVDGDEVRYSLADHWVEITPDQPAEAGVVDETEQPDDLGNHPDDVRAAYLEAQSRRDQVNAWAAARDMGDDHLADSFRRWSNGADLNTADSSTLAQFLAHLQR